jgi:dsRNA-specific ribonuclease
MYKLDNETISKVIDTLFKDKPEIMSACIDAIYNDEKNFEAAEEFHRRHMTPSCGVITIYEAEAVKNIVETIHDEICGKVVVEIGAGVGLLAIGMAVVAKEVYAIEVDPAWSWAFTEVLYNIKPPNLTFIFGKAETMIDKIHADVAVIVTRSGHDEMQEIGKKLASKVIDVYEKYPTIKSSTDIMLQRKKVN